MLQSNQPTYPRESTNMSQSNSPIGFMRVNRLMKPITSRILFLCFLIPVYCVIMFSCSQSEFDSIDPDNNVPEGDPVEISISLNDSPGYSDSDMNNTGNPSTRESAPLVAEWVKPEHFSVTRSADDYEGPAIAAMELFETPDSADVSGVTTRATMASGIYFRLIAFKKSGSSYVFQSVADYTSNGASAPTLKQGKMAASMGATYRFVAYSFNNSSAIGTLPGTYTWNSSSISIPNLSNDFMIYDSGDKVVSGESYSLSISFTHQLCKLTIKPSVTGFSTNNYSCSNAYISQGGNSSSWTIGSASIAANTNNTANFSIANTTSGSATIRIVPFAAARTISVYFGTLSVGGKAANGTTITSSQSVKLLAGKSYTMIVQFKKMMGNQVPSGDINLTGNGCTAQDKTDLAKLTWADGNLKSTGSSNYVWTTSSDYGYYYTWYSTYTGNTSTNSTDPCSKLNSTTYGTGWRTPSNNELTKLARCTNKTLVSSPAKGMWFMNSSKGLFLPAAGFRYFTVGAGTTASYGVGTYGYYWSSNAYDSVNAYFLRLASGSSGINTYNKPGGFSVRCVKGTKQ